jgi:D-aminopeptidase
VLVQANFGSRPHFRVDGVPVGREISHAVVPLPWERPPESSSIIVVIATDAPLVGDQCRRLARHATLGVGRTGEAGMDSSGDIFLAFSTGNHYPAGADRPVSLDVLPHDQMDALFVAVAEAVEEAIVNALTAAVTTSGYQGHIAHALPLDKLVEVMARYRGV